MAGLGDLKSLHPPSPIRFPTDHLRISSVAEHVPSLEAQSRKLESVAVLPGVGPFPASKGRCLDRNEVGNTERKGLRFNNTSKRGERDVTVGRMKNHHQNDLYLCEIQMELGVLGPSWQPGTKGMTVDERGLRIPKEMLSRSFPKSPRDWRGGNIRPTSLPNTPSPLQGGSMLEGHEGEGNWA